MFLLLCFWRGSLVFQTLKTPPKMLTNLEQNLANVHLLSAEVLFAGIL